MPGVICVCGVAHQGFAVVVWHEPAFLFCTQFVHDVGLAVLHVVDLMLALGLQLLASLWLLEMYHDAPPPSIRMNI